MRMDEIGWHSVHGPEFINEREHGAGDWVFLLIKSPCRIFVNGEMRQFPAYTWILFTPEAYQKYGADGGEYYDDWMHFAPDADEETLFRELDIPLNTPVALPKGTEISKILRDICTEYYSARLHRTEITVQYFRILFYRLHEQLVRVNAVQDGSSDSGRLRQIKNFIFRKPFDRFEAARFADALNLSEDAFLQQYAAENGSSFADDLIHARLCYISEQMKVHLSENQTVEEIAQLCGYAGEDEFSAEFSRFIGKSPQQYLDELRA